MSDKKKSARKGIKTHTACNEILERRVRQRELNNRTMHEWRDMVGVYDGLGIRWVGYEMGRGFIEVTIDTFGMQEESFHTSRVSYAVSTAITKNLNTYKT